MHTYMHTYIKYTHIPTYIHTYIRTYVHKIHTCIYPLIHTHVREYIGILDQGRGHLLIHETTSEDVSFTKGSEIITNMGSVVEALYGRAKNIITQKAIATTVTV